MSSDLDEREVSAHELSEREVSTQTASVKSGGAVGRLRVMSAFERYGIVVVWGVMIAVYSAIEPSIFDTSGTFQTIFGSQAALMFLSMAFLCTVVVGEFVDLSVASILGLSATLLSVLSVNDHVNVAFASLIAIAVGAGAGAVNGLLRRLPEREHDGRDVGDVNALSGIAFGDL